MKRLIFSAVGIIMFMSMVVYSAPAGKTSVDPYQDVVVVGRDAAAITKVNVSSQTAAGAMTTIIAARATRQFLDIVNISDNSATVEIGVTSSTQTAGLFSLSATKAISDVFPGLTNYTGAIYGVGYTSTGTVRILEVY